MSDIVTEDVNLANKIRDELKRLRHAIVDAQKAGMSVEVPELTHLYLQHGTASGSPVDWKIFRTH